jgi:hypothetical protein
MIDHTLSTFLADDSEARETMQSNLRLLYFSACSLSMLLCSILESTTVETRNSVCLGL